MVNKENVMEALKGVMDPEIRRSIVDLEMVREVEIDGNNVHITIALTIPNCPRYSLRPNTINSHKQGSDPSDP